MRADRSRRDTKVQRCSFRPTRSARDVTCCCEGVARLGRLSRPRAIRASRVKMLLSSRRILRQRWVRTALSYIGAEYLRLVFSTNRRIIPPAQLYPRTQPELSLIPGMWHGQHLLAPFIQRRHDKAKVLISHHRDGDVNALTAERLGVAVIRGSGDPGGRFDVKGGVGAFRHMLEALRDGYSIALTADVPKI